MEFTFKNLNFDYWFYDESGIWVPMCNDCASLCSEEYICEHMLEEDYDGVCGVLGCGKSYKDGFKIDLYYFDLDEVEDCAVYTGSEEDGYFANNIFEKKGDNDE